MGYANGGHALHIGGEPHGASTAGCLALGVLAFGAALWIWTSFLGRRPTPKRARGVMLVALATATSAELSLCFSGHLQPWMVAAILLANSWGPLDAVLRYPVVHDIDTVFSVKQVLILCAKLVSFPFGMHDLLSSLPLLAALSALNFVVLPILYLVALPLDGTPEQLRQASKGIDDVDVALRLARIAADPGRRSECVRVIRQAAIVPRHRRSCSQLPLWKGEC